MRLQAAGEEAAGGEGEEEGRPRERPTARPTTVVGFRGFGGVQEAANGGPREFAAGSGPVGAAVAVVFARAPAGSPV